MKFLGPDTVPWGTPPLGFPTDDTVLPIFLFAVSYQGENCINLNICGGTSLALSFTRNFS